VTRDALDQLYRVHGHAVLRRARRMLRDDADAHDVLHDVFLDLHARPGQFAGHSSPATYLYAAATHACLNRIRNGKTRARLVAIETAGRDEGTAAAGDTRTLASEILAGLSDEEAALAIYLYCDELTHDEIAEVLGCSRRHVGDLAMRLRRRVMERVA
jgi:RNA polymerase sigma-70 factor (ECF subfamily)